MQAAVAALLGQQAHAARQLEGAREARHHVAVTLPVKLYLPRLVLHELRLVAPLDRAQLVAAPLRKQHPGHDQRHQPDQQERPQNDVKQAHPSEAFEHI